MRFTPLAAVAVIVAISTCTPSDSGRVAAPRIAAAHDGDFAGAPDLIVDGKALEGSWVVYDQILKEGTCTLEEGGVLDPTVPHRVVRFTVNTPNIGDADIALGDPAVHVAAGDGLRSEEHTSELQSQSNLVCRLLLEKKKSQHLAVPDLVRGELQRDARRVGHPGDEGLVRRPASGMDRCARPLPAAVPRPRRLRSLERPFLQHLRIQRGVCARAAHRDPGRCSAEHYVLRHLHCARCGRAAPSADVYPRHGRPRSLHVDGTGPRVARRLHPPLATSSITSNNRS